MADHELGIPTCGNGFLDVVGRNFPFLENLEKIEVKMRKHQRIVYDTYGNGGLYFPLNCLISLRSSTKSGYTAEFNQIGRDGLVGITSLFGDVPAESEAIVVTAGRAYRVSSTHARALFESSTDFRRTILTYLEAQMRESAQRIICNKRHSIPEQVCRTLLMAADRLDSQILSLTHEQLAIAIGCRREAVSISASKLQSAGIIRYDYGKITIVDRVALERGSCECYSVIRQRFGKFLLPRPSGTAMNLDLRN